MGSSSSASASFKFLTHRMGGRKDGFRLKRSAESISKLEDLCTNDKKRRRVTFNPDAYLTLIPCVDEFRLAGIHNDVWYSKNEMDRIVVTANFELKMALEWKQAAIRSKKRAAQDVADTVRSIKESIAKYH